MPSVLISTSGTAPANYYPAVIESNLSRIPLIILSADRPGFLINTGENQAIDQNNLFGRHVRCFIDIGLPNDKTKLLENKLNTAIQHVLGIKLKAPPGPVHLNFPFDEPLLPENIKNVKYYEINNVSKPNNNKIFNIPILEKKKKILIIVGPYEENRSPKYIIKLAEKINAPILADPLSQLRYGFDSNNIFSFYDILFKHKKLVPDHIIRFGRKPTSKILCQVLNNYKDRTTLIDKWQQFNDITPEFIQSNIKEFCNKQIKNINWKGDNNWIKIFEKNEIIIENKIKSNNEIHEGNIARACQESIKNKGSFIIGNSMPIRDVDMFTSTSNKKIHIFSNRGASGIDGVISTALGIATIKNNSLLLIGDLSFYHDMNGLLATQYNINLTIIIINNNGGGIFSFLPISKLKINTFNEFWTTNTNLDLKQVAKLYKCKYYNALDLKQLKNHIQNSFTKNGIKIIEIKTKIKNNIVSHKNLIKDIEYSLSNT